MANGLNNPDKLIERILSDARAAADAIAADAEKEVGRIAELAVSDVDRLEAETGQEARRIREDILERSRTNAELDSRKHALKSRRELMDKAFKAAEAKLNALGGAERNSFLVSLALRECDGGETLCPLSADAEALKGLLGEINAGLERSGRKKVSLGEAVDIEGGGFKLMGEGYEKNCSFASALRDARERQEGEVAALLFG